MENKKENKAKPKKRFVKIIYKDIDDKVKKIILPIPEEEYQDHLSYRENLQLITGVMMDEGGFWADNSTIIPFHRIVSIQAHIVRPQQNQSVKKAPKKRTRGKRSFGTKTTSTVTIADPPEVNDDKKRI